MYSHAVFLVVVVGNVLFLVVVVVVVVLVVVVVVVVVVVLVLVVVVVESLKLAQNTQFLTLFTWKCAARHNGVHFFDMG